MAGETNFDPVLLRTFLTVANGLSFTRAAEQLGLSQPTVSQHVRRLEEALGDDAAAPAPEAERRVPVEPISSRHFMSIEAASSSASVVTASDSSSRPTSRPTTTTVSGERCSSRIFWASTTWSVREREAGL